MFLFYRQVCDVWGQYIFTEDFGVFTLIECEDIEEGQAIFHQLRHKSKHTQWYNDYDIASNGVGAESYCTNISYLSIEDAYQAHYFKTLKSSFFLLVHFKDGSRKWFDEKHEDVTSLVLAQLKVQNETFVGHELFQI